MSNALEIAAERYAKGEITKEEFEDIKASLGSLETNAAPQDGHKTESSNASEQPTTNIKSKSGGLPEWIWGPAVILGVLLGTGYVRYNADIDRAEKQCMSQFNNAARCSCFISEISSQTSILDETPLLNLLRDQSDERFERLSQNAIRRCTR